MYINEIVKLDTQGKFIPAVQLSDFDTPADNLGLIKSYIFANHTPDGHGHMTKVVGSIDLLKALRQAYVNESMNRFVVVANYGHGKSHLALVLANYFARPYHSEEVQEVLKRIAIPLQNNLPEVENFRDLKQQYDQFLVLRLRGDVPRTLREQFFPALRKALKEYPETEAVELPFWHTQAIEWLQGRADDKQAKQFLANLGTDIPSLILEVNENKHEAYEQYVQLFAHLNHGVKPNAESNYSLREAVLWITDNLCGPSKPLAGLMVLFDEFSQFVERYTQSGAIGDLQDLLQGIGDRKGKSLFLAFSPLDPDEVAERLVAGQVLQNIKKELGRIDRKYELYSLMESVLSASINPSNASWERFLKESPDVKGLLYGQATEVAWETYHNRYDKELKWTNDKFREVITKGCFPLHPMTTALLCHLRMQQGLDDDARTILKFVREKIELKLNEAAQKDGRVNWVLPIEIADYFGKKLASEQLYTSYENAIDNLEQVFGDNATQTQYDVLKALLLQTADGLNIAGGKQVALIAHLAGVDFDTAKSTLKELSTRGVTKFDENSLYNSFWPLAVNPQALEQKIRALVSDKPFGNDELLSLNDHLGSVFPGSDKIEVGIAWGNSVDWAANTTILTREKFSAQELRESMNLFQLSYEGLVEGSRGLVVWLLAFNQDDIDFFRANALKTLQDAFPAETPPPVLLVIPPAPTKNVADQFMRLQALESIGKDPDVVKEVGQGAFNAEMDRTRKSLLVALGQLFGDLEKYASIVRKPTDLVVPQAYKANLIALPTVTIQEVLLRLYQLAYPYRPPEFFTDLPCNPRKGPSPLREAVKTVSKNLISNKVGTALSGMVKLPKERLCQQNLMAKWHLLSTTYWIQEPDVLSLKHAWNYLEEQIKPDDQEIFVRDFLPNLFNSPFGFDFNTATLLFTAWIGKHNNELRYFANGKAVGLDFIEQQLDAKTLQEFLGKVCVKENLSISRRDVDKTLTDGRELVEEIQKALPRSQAIANDNLATLNEIVNSGVCPESEIAVFNQAIADLTNALESSRQYDASVKKMLPAIANESSVQKLLEFNSAIQRLPMAGLVEPSQPARTEVQSKVDARLAKVVEANCKQAEAMSQIESADANRNLLRDQKLLLHQHGCGELEAMVSAAEIKLEERIKKLKTDAEDQAKRNQINAMTSKANLGTLYDYAETLKGISAGSPDLFALRDKKAKEIQDAISELTVFAQSVSEIYQTVDPNEAEALYERILKYISRYSDTEHEEKLNAAAKYLKELRSFVSEVKKLETQSFNSPEDVSKFEALMGQAHINYDHQIAPAHLVIMEKAHENVAYQVKAEYEKTEKRITEIESSLDQFSSVQIREKLLSISPFVSPTMEEKIEKIRNIMLEKERQEKIALAEKESQDIIDQIEKLFFSIQDVGKKQECLERLKKNVSPANQ